MTEQMRYFIARKLLSLANAIQGKSLAGLPRPFREIESAPPDGTGCYSEEFLRAEVERAKKEGSDQPTIESLFDGWVSFEKLEPKQVRRLLIMNDFDVE